ncbi:XylR N-terminal domain-containing protein [Aneurinibacillus uraniidurans]|uniref:XylR N-terminal domain-containing protein n=1 Tax=Aneurinibacillus uraniidurans TaxID=2966586 RepID=UPI0023498180|nr:XylR N-terminal domain-containing protein [Aneurinibacillus sp. B1]WCN39500.1 XylR N-terminal domain-containing protein [Aneurinibacillus sp. B1]
MTSRERMDTTKANELSLRNLLRFYPKQGEIFLKDRRMVISSADAWGVLRHDLIAALGTERAKRFLLRYGWHCGRNDARNLKEMFEWESDIEWLLAGPQMHTISGNVFSRATRVEVNREQGTFYLEGTWENSYEAEQHLLHFPKHHESVCYMLSGYAGGYSTEYFGKKVVYKEVECVGKGDTTCRFIGKTVEEWGDEILEELADYEDENLADELDLAYQRIEKQQHIMSIGMRLSQKLTQVVLQGKGLSTIAQVLGESLSCSVVVESPEFETIASYGRVPHGAVRALRCGEIGSESERTVIKKLFDEQQTVQVDMPAGGGLYAHKRVIAPILVKSQVRGFISLLKEEGSFGQIELMSLERAASVCALQKLNEQTVIETEQRIKGELLAELLNKDADMSVIMKRFQYLGYQADTPHYVFVFQMDSCEKEGTYENIAYMERRPQLIDFLSGKLERAGYRALVSTQLNRVYGLIPVAYIEQQKLSVEAYGTYLLTQLNELMDSKDVVLGISNVCYTLSVFARGYQEAIQAIEIARLKKQTCPVVRFAELGHLTLLLNARHPEELEAFAYEKLGMLHTYDEKNESELVKTLYYYIENECNLHKTARVMNVSISGMRYRLRRIQELTGTDLTVSCNRFETQLALEIMLVLGKISLNPVVPTSVSNS